VSAIRTAVAARGGSDQIKGVIFHTDRGATCTAQRATSMCRALHITQSMGRVGSCFDDAAAEAFVSSLEWEVLSRTEFRSAEHAHAVVLDWCYGFYNHKRRHTHNGKISPVNCEAQAA
jgi:transposase InsO family protein